MRVAGALLSCPATQASSMPSLPISRTRLALLLGALSMFGALSIDTIFPAFPAMANDFGASKLAMQQTIAVYLIAYALMSLLHGPVSDAHGRKRVILTGVAVFTAASIGCALAPSLEWLLAFRALQGLSAGVGLIVSRAIVRDCLDGAQAQKLLSTITMIFGIAPAIAPIIGGWILGFASWHGIFWFLALWGAAIWLAVLAWLPETHVPDRRRAFHPAQLWHGNLAMLRNPAMRRLALAGSFNFGALFLYIASAPAFVIDLLGLHEQQFAWFFAPMIGGMMVGAFTSGRMAGRVSGARMVTIGFALCALAVVLNLVYNLAVAQPRLPWGVMPMVLNAFGIALVFPVLTLSMLDLYPRQRGAASSLQAFVSLSSNAVIAGLVSPWVSSSGLHLAMTASACTAIAWVLWRLYLRQQSRVATPAAEALALEPADRL